MCCKKVLFVFIIIFSIYSVSAWNTNTFTNGLDNERMIFTQSEDKVKYLQIPEGVSVINAFLDLKSEFFMINPTLRVGSLVLPLIPQVTANVYGTFLDKFNAFDKNVDTYTFDNSYFMERNDYRYFGSTFEPISMESVIIKTEWTLGDLDGGTMTITLQTYDGSTWDTIPLAAYTGTTSPKTLSYVGTYHLNKGISGLRLVFNTSTSSGSHGSNIKVYELDYPNSQNIRTNNINAYLNEYLNSCTYISGYCEIPFIFHSNGEGILGYSNMQFDDWGFTKASQKYNFQSTSGIIDNFYINVSYSDSYYSDILGKLIYNGTEYSGTKTGSGVNSIFSTDVEMPKVTSNTEVPFYWAFEMTRIENSSIKDFFNSTIQTQTIRPNPYWHAYGDLNCDGVVDIIDVVALIDYAFRGGAEKECVENPAPPTSEEVNHMKEIATLFGFYTKVDWSKYVFNTKTTKEISTYLFN